MSKQLTLLRPTDADDMKETLHAYRRTKIRQIKASIKPNKYHQQSVSTTIMCRLNRPERCELSGLSVRVADRSQSRADRMRIRFGVAFVHLPPPTKQITTKIATCGSMMCSEEIYVAQGASNSLHPLSINQI